jgi:uncharacterized delta-60 repeat protein
MTTYRRRVTSIALSLAAYLFSVVTLAIPGQPGTLDTSFGSGGKVVTAIGTSNARATVARIQPDGKLLLAGYCFSSTTYDFCALRYLANGTLDPSFGSGGKVITPIGTSDAFANAAALQSDGKVLLAGDCPNGTNTDFCAVRYNDNGTLDASFGSGGKVITQGFTIYDYVSSLALQPDGKLVLAGTCLNGTTSDFCALRYLANGTLDTNFGSGGKVVTPIGAYNDFAGSIAQQPDGKLVLAGDCNTGTNASTNYDFCALRYLANGTLDASFGSGGKVITPVGIGDDISNTVTLQPDSKLLLTGFCHNGANFDFCALRYNANGTLDTSFGSGGKVVTPVGSSTDYAADLALQPDGKLVLAGECYNGTNSDFCALRYLTNGTLDASFGIGGKVVTPMGSGNNSANAVVLQPDGKLVLAGSCFNGTSDNFCAVRYDGNTPAPTCAVDLDGDTKVIATIDSLVHVRIALGLTNAAVTNGINFPASASRKDWTSISNYLVGKTLDIDGDGFTTAAIDSLIHARIALGLTGSAVVNGITFSPTATRNTWPLIRDYLVTQCGMSLVQ